ncbi:HAD family hydrolase [Candidatus Woesearchaeota archaeon]|nr:HAD family hydrolase [Candidatus Woesearchaeota archaeon]
MRKQRLGGIKAVGFDFDGTLIVSEEQKAKAMAEIFREQFGIKKGVEKAYASLVGSASNRHQKVNSLFQKLLHRTPTVRERQSVAREFGKHYQRHMKMCPLFQCSNLIKELRKQVSFLFLLSLENKKEVTAIAQHCGVAKHFDEILGGPKPKVENLLHIIKKHKLKPHQVLYIGDAHSDVIASKKMNVRVVLLGKKHTYERLKEDLAADFVFSSLCDVPKVFSTMILDRLRRKSHPGH